jgi:Spy/CpxP family protein refolding chaperone
MKKMLFILALILLFPAAAAVAEDVPPPPPPPAPSQEHSAVLTNVFPAPSPLSTLHIISRSGISMLSSRLKLTDEQKSKINDLMSKADAAVKPKIESQKKAVDKYMQLLQKNDVTETELIAAADEAIKAESVIVTEKLKTLQALRALLNDDQKTELNSMLTRIVSPIRIAPMTKN